MPALAIDKKFAAVLALKAGQIVRVGYGQGLMFDVSKQTLARLQHDLLAEKRWQLELYTSGIVRFRFGDDPRADTTDEIIASLQDEIAQIEATL